MSRDEATGSGLSVPVAIAGGVALLIIGAAIGLSLGNRSTAQPLANPAPAVATATRGTSAPAGTSEAAVTLTPEMVKRAGIELVTVSSEGKPGALTIPGVVEPNAYKEVRVTSLVDGRVSRVMGELGQHVKQGAALAGIYSPQLAELQTSVLAMRAELDAAHEKLMRTERLVQIGAASRQELEQVQAEHTRHQAAVEGAIARLVLLGVSRDRAEKLGPGDTAPTLVISAPMGGVITKRDANAGLNVESGTPLFTVVDLSTVWIVGDLYESSLPVVRVGSVATISSDAYPGLKFEGRVSYIDPQVQEATRTARVRIEVPNP